MSEQKRRDKSKDNKQFIRASKYLYPYRKEVIVSIVCAIFVGLAFAGGIGTILPIMRVLIAGEAVETWVNRQIVESRLGVTLSDDPSRVTITKIKPGGPADVAKIPTGTVIAEGENASGQLRSAATANKLDLPQTVDLKPAPFYMNWARFIASKFPADPVGSIAAVLVFIIIISLIGNVARYYQEHYSDRAGILAVNDIRRQLYDHILHTPIGYFGKQGTSDVTSRLVQDCQTMQDGFKTVLGQTIQEPIKAILALVLALMTSWKLTLFIVLFAPVMVLIIQKFGKKMRRASRAALQKSSIMLGQIEGTMNGIRVVKSSNAERFERRRYTRIMGNLVDEQLRMSRIDAVSAPVMETLTLLVVCCVVLFAGYLVLKTKTLESTSFFLVMIYLAAIGESLRRFGKVNNALQKSNAAGQRVFEMLDRPVERPRHLIKADGKVSTVSPAERPRIQLRGVEREIAFENVSFAYPSSESKVLDGVSLRVEKGKTIAVVGRNGSGKTTLLALLPRFYDPIGGRILIDGIDIKDITLKSLREQISVVTQESVIFPGSISENIAYGLPLTSQEQIEVAAKKAYAHDFILQKPNGYQTTLEGLGGQLSGGQKQRLNIARAILKNSPVLILDEATSQIDTENEHLIQKALEDLMKDRTTFVIAHRMSTIKNSDMIVVMDAGKIVDQGKHDELFQRCETYRLLYEKQITH